MKTDFLIIGQGIAGTLLSHYLLQAGHRVVVVDNGATHNASQVAAAVINPLSGRHWTTASDAALFIPEALACYRSLEISLQQRLLYPMPMYIFGAGQSYTTLTGCSIQEQEQLQGFFDNAERVFKNEHSFLVDAAALLQSWKQYLLEREMLWQEVYEHKNCTTGKEGIRYKGLEAKKIIFCEGAPAQQNPLWESLPFTRNRGEALLLRILELPQEAIYHNGLRLVPRGGELFWCGSNYQWHYDNLEPDKAWRAVTVAELEQWLRLPFEITGHIVAERPTTAGQIPLVGLHPQLPSAGILNGLGTRGFSAGPFWAAELARKLTNETYTIRNYNEAWLAAKLR